MELSSLDLNLLLTLEALLAEESVTRAAGRVGVTPSAMSQRLRRLQEVFGDPILVRAGRHMRATARAAALRPAVADAVASVRRVFSDQGFEPGDVRRSFRVAATDQISLLLGADLEQRLSSSLPGLDLYVVPAAANVPVRLGRGDLDLAVGFWRRPPEDLRLRVLFEDSYVTVVRRGHPLAREPSLERFLAARHLLVAPRGSPTGRVDLVLEEAGLRRRVVRLEPTFVAAAHVVARTDLVVTMSRRVATVLSTSLPLALVPPPIPLPNYPVVQVWHERVHRDPVHQHVRATFAELSATLAPAPANAARITVFE
jgi:DNA-binding transcriptional LysR family regulator